MLACLVKLSLNLGVGDVDANFVGLQLKPSRTDQEGHYLILQLRELIGALLLELGVGRVGLTLHRLRRRGLLGGDALDVVRWVGSACTLAFGSCEALAATVTQR